MSVNRQMVALFGSCTVHVAPSSN